MKKKNLLRKRRELKLFNKTLFYFIIFGEVRRGEAFIDGGRMGIGLNNGGTLMVVALCFFLFVIFAFINRTRAATAYCF